SARSSRPACGSALAGASSVEPRAVLNPRPASIANIVSSASAATIQGSGLILAAGACVGRDVAPQWWQKFDPGVMSPLHEAQVAPARGAPQFAQYRPLAGDEQAGQATGVESLEGSGGMDVIPPQVTPAKVRKQYAR